MAGKTTLARKIAADRGMHFVTIDAESNIVADRTKFGPLLEGFVFSELSKLVAQQDAEASISHYPE